MGFLYVCKWLFKGFCKSIYNISRLLRVFSFLSSIYIYVTIYIYVYIYLDPEEPTFFKGLYKEITIRNPRKVGSLGSRHVYNTMHQPCMYDALYGFSGLYFVGQEPAWVLPLRMSLEELNLLQEKWVYLLNPKPKP